MTIEEVKTRFVADIAKYKKDIQNAQKVLNKFVQTSDTSMNKASTAEHKYQMALEKTKQKQLDLTKAQNTRSTSTQKLGSDLAHTARNMMTLYYSAKTVAAIFKEGIDYNRFTQNAEASFRVMTKSATEARNIMADLREFAVESPLSFEETVESARQLMAYGFQTKELVSNMEMLGTVALATGHSLTDVSYVYGTLKTQGRAYSRDLMQFAMRGIPIYQELAAVMGVNEMAIKKMTEEGKIGFREVERAFQRMTGEGGRFYGMVEERMKTLDGAAFQFKDSWQLAMGALTESLVKTITQDLLDMAEAINKNIEAFRTFGKSAVWFFQSLGDALNLISNPINVVWDKIFGTDFSKMQSRGLNNKAWRDLLGVDAVIEAEKAAKKLAETRNYLNDVSVLQGEKQRGPKPIPIIDPEEVEKAKKLMDDLLASLEKYRDEYRRLKAQQMVDDKKNIYALAQLELDLDRRKIQEEFKGQTDLMNQALAYADLIHEHKIVQIYKEEEERRRIAQKALDDAAFAIELRNQQMKLEEAYQKDLEARQRGAKPMQAYLDAGMGFDRNDINSVRETIAKLSNSLVDAENNLEAYVNQYEFMLEIESGYNEEIERTINLYKETARYLEEEIRLLKEREKILEWTEAGDRARDAARPIPGAFDGAQWDINGTPISDIGQSVQGTEVAQMVGGYDPMVMAVKALVDFAMSIENVQKVLNPFKTIFEAMRPIVEPLVNGVLQPLVNILEKLGEVIGNILAPLLGLFQIVQSVNYILIIMFLLPLQMLGEGFKWLYDGVMVPVGNGIIRVINGVIDGINKALGFLGVNIKKLQELATTTETQNKKIRESNFIATFEEMVKRLNAELDRQIESYKDLYQVGAISGVAYTTEVARLNDNRVTIEQQQLQAILDTDLSIQDMSKWIKENTPTYEQLTGFFVKTGDGLPTTDSLPKPPTPTPTPTPTSKPPPLPPHFRGPLIDSSDDRFKDLFNPAAAAVAAATGRGFYAEGSPNLPSDMIAQVHQGEGIVPRTFMDAIRAGELTLSGKDGSNKTTYNNYYITVEGSVMKENDMIDGIGRKLNQRVRRGYV